ncbi:hypothetical protein M378DRAFT_157108, partial [Amanita muscaria Koide BX008]
MTRACPATFPGMHDDYLYDLFIFLYWDIKASLFIIIVTAARTHSYSSRRCTPGRSFFL